MMKIRSKKYTVVYHLGAHRGLCVGVNSRITSVPFVAHRNSVWGTHSTVFQREREMEQQQWTEQDFLSCSGSLRFAGEMVAAAPFADLDHVLRSARDIWFNKIDVKGWLESFAAHPDIGSTSKSISQFSKQEQSAAMATATDSTLQELIEWNALYRERFGFVFLICASGRGSPDILAELKKRYSNRPIVELEKAAEEEMKIIELRLAKLFEGGRRSSPSVATDKPGGGVPDIPSSSQRTRPPITTHVLDVSRGSPASGIEVHLEMWSGNYHRCPSFSERNSSQWVLKGSSVTNADGRSGALMGIVDKATPGIYRISFDTGKYQPSGFFPFVSIIFEIRESQVSEHFHVPLLLSPFSFTTYRGS